ncbi:MAG: hypothetical protein WDO68_19715 [Gammaproteobacteria bacterium]
MKTSLVQKIVNATLLLGPIVGALVAAAAVRAAEPGPTVTITTLDADATEAGHAAVLLATRQGASITQPLIVPIKLGGTATLGADYVNPGIGITFPAQTPLVMVKITPVRDALVEGKETVIVTLVPNPGAYTLGEEKSATATIADAAGSASSPAGSTGGGPIDPLRKGGGTSRPTPPTPTGLLTVEITLDGQGHWKNDSNGAYSAMNFHRTMKYTMPLQGFVGGGSGLSEIDRRDQKSQPMLPNLHRYVVLQPQTAMTGRFGAPCGKGEVAIADEYKGMEVGDPGQPPLVPYTETWRGGGAFPSGDKTVPERDLCLARFVLDTEKHVAHIIIDGSDSHVKTQITHNSFKAVPINVRFQGDDLDASAKAKLSFFDVPVPAGAKTFDFTRSIENFSQATGKGNTHVPLRATVKWHVTMQ